MTIEILPGTPADVKRCFDIQKLAFTVHPETAEVNKMLFPGSGPVDPESETAAIKRLSDLIFGNPNVRFIKAIDTSLSGDEALVGWAKWHVHPEGMPALPPRQWGKEVNLEACKLFFGAIDELEGRLICGKPCMCLKPVMAAAEHQRRGIGRKLINWGLELAASLDLPVFLIASPIGHTLYQKCGFRDVETLTMDLSEHGVTDPHTVWAMLWEKEKQST